jgi:CBS domain-containing protein
MLRLQDIMTRDIVTLSPEHSIREAMSILTSRHISGAPVLSNSRVVGVVSLTDLAELAANAPGTEAPRMRESDWSEWDEPVELPEGEEPPSAYFQRLWEDSDAEVTERTDGPALPESDALQEHTVGEAMTRDVRFLHPGTSVEDAAQFMRDASIHRVLVMDNRELLGVVSTKDISNAVADRKLTSRTLVFGAPRYL